MELLYNFLILVSIVLLILLKTNIRRSKAQTQGFRLPPGPRALPIIGCIHHLLWSPTYRALHDLAVTYGPVMYLRLGQVPFLIVSSAEAAREVMKTHDAVFASRPQTLGSSIMTYGCVDIAFAPYCEYWRQLRKICVLELFSARRVQSFRTIREEESCNLVRSISSVAVCDSVTRGVAKKSQAENPAEYRSDTMLNTRASSSPINISQMLMTLTNNVVVRATLGSKFKDQKLYMEALNEVRVLMGGFQPVDFYPESDLVRLMSGASYKLERCHQRMDGILEGIIEERREKMKNDGLVIAGEETLLDVLLNLQENGKFGFSPTTDNIKAVIFDLFAAGTGTTSSTLDWAMSNLMRNPTVMQKAQSEVRDVLDSQQTHPIMEDDTQKFSYLKLVIKETLRLYPPTPLLLPRESMETCQVQGYTIPSKTRVFVNAWAMGRDPKYWKDPEVFDPERFKDCLMDFKASSFEYIPFGAGRRICPGMLFGLATIELVLAHLLYYFDWKLPGGVGPDGLDMSETYGVGLRRKYDLCLCATPLHVPKVD